ncbi:uncharacterized protein LOC6652229 isoform X5 [Drosophila willistoni]|uniref:uncharacterized protein LOC6652229 isoform X5 n=1 Tax=Drosophila willistoni TaxID=7260 RepID=UPI00017D9A32|nr:uncharacterized protein LOC6652229 isoform X5 [Drosophila willistoni]
MYTEFWLCGLFLLIILTLVARECYLFVKLKFQEWNMRVYARLLRHEMMLRLAIEDRQGTVYSVSDDRPHNRYGDIFFIEPGSEEANRIREQLEKDEKDLPSYDEVMRMCNLTTPTAAAAVAGTAQLPPTIDGNLAIGIAALPAPPYSEADPQASPSQTSAFAVPASNPPSINAISMEPSTSRAAQTPTSPASVTVTLPSTVTNTEV